VYIVCIYLHILMSNTISISDDDRVLKNNTTEVTSGAVNANLSEAPQCTPAML